MEVKERLRILVQALKVISYVMYDGDVVTNKYITVRA